MEDIARLAANMLKRDLYKSGQIGRTEKNVFTFDGNTEGRLQFPFCPLYKISNKVPDISTLVKLTSNMGGVEYELSAEHCTIETNVLGAIIQAEISGALVDVARIMKTAGTASEEYVGLYVISTEEGYLARIEFEDTITPMKPEYLPGVCLPVYLQIPQAAWDGLLAGGTIPLDMATAQQIEKAGNENIPLYVWTNYTVSSETARMSIRFDCSLAGEINGGIRMEFSGQMLDIGTGEVWCLGASYFRNGSDITLLVQKFAPPRKT